MLALRLPNELDERLDALAKASGRSKNEHALEALTEYVADMEDAQIAEQRLADLRAGRSHTVPIEELMQRYGLAD